MIGPAQAKIISVQERIQFLSDVVMACNERLCEGRVRTDVGDAFQAIKLIMAIEAEQAARTQGAGASDLLRIQERYQAFLECSTDIPIELTGLAVGARIASSQAMSEPVATTDASEQAKEPSGGG